MWADHDADTGAVRLDTEAVDGVVAAARGDRTPEGAVADLLASGVADPALAAIRTPKVRVRLCVAGERLVQRHDAWVADDVAALRLAVRGDEHQLMAVAPQMLAPALARVVRLGPRTVGPRIPYTLDHGLAADWFGDDPSARSRALDAVGATYAWTLTADGPTGDATTTVVDGRQGAFLLDGSDARVLRPVSATVLWRGLTSTARTKAA